MYYIYMSNIPHGYKQARVLAPVVFEGIQTLASLFYATRVYKEEVGQDMTERGRVAASETRSQHPLL